MLCSSTQRCFVVCLSWQSVNLTELKVQILSPFQWAMAEISSYSSFLWASWDLTFACMLKMWADFIYRICSFPLWLFPFQDFSLHFLVARVKPKLWSSDFSIIKWLLPILILAAFQVTDWDLYLGEKNKKPTSCHIIFPSMDSPTVSALVPLQGSQIVHILHFVFLT